MTNALATTPAAAEPRFANPLQQIAGLAQQPAVRRSLPMILLVGLIASAALAWAMLSTPTQRTLFPNLADADKAAVTQALTQAGITSHLDPTTGAVTVDEDKYAKARMLLASQDLPKATPGGYALLDQLPMGVSRAVEGERLRQARETELARSIQEIDGVVEARVHLAMPEASVFVRDSAAPSASVILKLAAGRTLADAQVRSVVNLVASSVPGLKPEAVTIVDQMGSLLSKPSDGSGDSASDARIDFQRRVEDKYRQQLSQLLTPLVGAGNFSAEVQADVDLSETQATRESYDKQGALRAEQGNWTATAGDGAAPGGIPGALSNTPPPASSVSAPQPQPQPTPGAAPATGAPGAVPDSAKRSDAFSRAYDLGREVSVTRGTPGQIKRVSVAILLRDPETGRPRSPVEIAQVTQLVRAAVGADPARGDVVTVISRKFASGADADGKPAWYQAAWVPVFARNATALVIALLVLLLGVRPLAKALLKRRDEAARLPAPVFAPMSGTAPTGSGPNGQPVSVEQIDTARNFDERIGMVRGFTRDNPARAALAVRDMIKADAR